MQFVIKKVDYHLVTRRRASLEQRNWGWWADPTRILISVKGASSLLVILTRLRRASGWQNRRIFIILTKSIQDAYLRVFILDYLYLSVSSPRRTGLTSIFFFKSQHLPVQLARVLAMVSSQCPKWPASWVASLVPVRIISSGIFQV